MKNFEESSIKDLLTYDFEDNEYVTVRQALTFYNRMQGRNVSNIEEVLQYAESDGIYLPSDLVYDTKSWEIMWREILLGNTVFEKVNDYTYSIVLIQGYLKIYLNEQGYSLIKQGLIPAQLYMYSPFTNISDLDKLNLDKNASMGFLLEILMRLEYTSQEDRLETIRKSVISKIEELTNKQEEDWQMSEINLYDYYGISYYGEYKYLLDNGYLKNIDIKDLMSDVSPNDFLKIGDF